MQLGRWLLVETQVFGSEVTRPKLRLRLAVAARKALKKCSALVVSPAVVASVAALAQPAYVAYPVGNQDTEAASVLKLALVC